MDFRGILYCGFLVKSVDILNFWLKSDKNNRHLTWRPTYIYHTI